MAGIPWEILHNGILTRLPARSLMRFKCVSKTWLDLISSPEFIQLHLFYAIKNDLLILTGSDSCLYSFNLDFPTETTAVKLPTNGGIEPTVVGCCNGLLCIQTYRPYCLSLLNPSTHTYRNIPSLLPPRRCCALNFGFGYDATNDDYKILRIADRYPSLGFLTHQMDRILHLFSFSNNSWELLDFTSPLSPPMGVRENGALVNHHLLHWKFWCSQQRQFRICCFNLSEKQWTHDVPLPSAGSNSQSDDDRVIQDAVLDFGVLDGRLYLSTKNLHQSAIDIWVMNEYGVQDSWAKLCQISDSTIFSSLRVSPIAYTGLNHRTWLRTLHKTEHRIFWYDIEGESTETAEINGVANCIWIVPSKGSLVSVPGGFRIGTATTKEN